MITGTNRGGFWIVTVPDDSSWEICLSTVTCQYSHPEIRGALAVLTAQVPTLKIGGLRDRDVADGGIERRSRRT
jgi:hypothetical protein